MRHLYNQPYERDSISRMWTGMEMAYIVATIASTGVQMAQASDARQAATRQREQAERQFNAIQPPKVPKAPGTSPEEIARRTEAQKAKIMRGKRQQPTLLTGPKGLLEPAVVKKKTLLG